MKKQGSRVAAERPLGLSIFVFLGMQLVPNRQPAGYDQARLGNVHPDALTLGCRRADFPYWRAAGMLPCGGVAIGAIVSVSGVICGSGPSSAMLST